MGLPLPGLGRTAPRIVIVGAGLGGLSAALQLAGAGFDVTVVERHAGPGGKMRTLPSVAGPVDAGPTVFTLKRVLDDLLADVGERAEDHLTLVPEQILARHWWPDGSTLDLHADKSASIDAVRAFGGEMAAREFAVFCEGTAKLFDVMDAPIMRASAPDLGALTKAVLANPAILPRLMSARSLWSDLGQRFCDPRLQQLFARYATYVGGSPFASPALLSLIWHAEASGVWRVQGGMHGVAGALERLAKVRGVNFVYEAHVDEIRVEKKRASGVTLASGEKLNADAVVFNGDPQALNRGALGRAARRAVPGRAVNKRSLSAFVWSFAATPSGASLEHNNVFFNADYSAEFTAIRRGEMPTTATLYVCAQDRGAGLSPSGPERFEIIMNAAATTNQDQSTNEDRDQCRHRTFTQLRQHGLTFDPTPDVAKLTTPADFASLFPESDGSLYGLSPQSMMATFLRPTPRSGIRGLYLAGGGVHPGAGVPMALSSGRHAGAAIARDLASTSMFRPTAMPGGISTGSPTTATAASRSSAS